MGPACCRATPALTSQPTRPAPRPPGACHRPVVAVGPLLDLVSGWSRRVTLVGSADCPLVNLGGPAGGCQGEKFTVRKGRAAIRVLGTVLRWGGCMVRGPARRSSSRRRRRRRSLFRIVHARGLIPNEVGPARCRATPDLASQPTRRRRLYTRAF